jgi:hypothetical protein
VPRKKSKRPEGRTVARRPANPKASRSGSGFHEPSRYSKKDRRAGKRPMDADVEEG